MADEFDPNKDNDEVGRSDEEMVGEEDDFEDVDDDEDTAGEDADDEDLEA